LGGRHGGGLNNDAACRAAGPAMPFIPNGQGEQVVPRFLVGVALNQFGIDLPIPGLKIYEGPARCDQLRFLGPITEVPFRFDITRKEIQRRGGFLADQPRLGCHGVGNNTVVEKTTAVLPTCTLELTASYASGTLTVDVLVGTNVAVTANLWGTAESDIISLFNGQVPVIEVPITTAITKSLPPIGTVGVLGTLTLPGLEIICSDFETVDTGSAP